MSSTRSDESEQPPGPGGALVDLYRELRATQPLTYSQIAAKTGLSKGHLSEVFNGRKAPSPDTAQEIAEALGADPDTARRARLHAEQLAEFNRYQRRNAAAPPSADDHVAPAASTSNVNTSTDRLTIQQSGDGQWINNSGIVLGNLSINVARHTALRSAVAGVVRLLARLRLTRRVLILTATASVGLAGLVSAVVMWQDPPLARPPSARSAPSGRGGVAASSFVPLGTTRVKFDMSASGTRLTIHSPVLLDDPVGAWLPGSFCTSDVSFDVKLDPTAKRDADGNPGAYGYAIAPQATVKTDLPYGWSMDHRWDPPNWNEKDPGFYFAPVLMADPEWEFKPSSPAPDVREWHHVHAFTDGKVSRMEVDGKSVGDFSSGSGGCGGLLFRVWGGATAHFDHIAVSHP